MKREGVRPVEGGGGSLSSDLKDEEEAGRRLNRRERHTQRQRQRETHTQRDRG